MKMMTVQTVHIVGYSLKEIDWLVLAESDSERMLTRTLTSLQRGFHLDKKLVFLFTHTVLRHFHS